MKFSFSAISCSSRSLSVDWIESKSPSILIAINDNLFKLINPVRILGFEFA